MYTVSQVAHKLTSNMDLFVDLNKEETFRNLSKPIGALNESRLAQLKVWSIFNYAFKIKVSYLLTI